MPSTTSSVPAAPTTAAPASNGPVTNLARFQASAFYPSARWPATSGSVSRATTDSLLPQAWMTVILLTMAAAVDKAFAFAAGVWAWALHHVVLPMRAMMQALPGMAVQSAKVALHLYRRKVVPALVTGSHNIAIFVNQKLWRGIIRPTQIGIARAIEHTLSFLFAAVRVYLKTAPRLLGIVLHTNDELADFLAAHRVWHRLQPLLLTGAFVALATLALIWLNKKMHAGKAVGTLLIVHAAVVLAVGAYMG